MKCSSNAAQKLKNCNGYRFFTMKNMLINLVQTNIAMVGQDDEDDNDMEDYDSKDYSLWEQGKGEHDSSDTFHTAHLVTAMSQKHRNVSLLSRFSAMSVSYHWDDKKGCRWDHHLRPETQEGRRS